MVWHRAAGIRFSTASNFYVGRVWATRYSSRRSYRARSHMISSLPIPPLIISPWSRWSVGSNLVSTAQIDGTNSNTWPVANQAIYVPFFTPAPYTVVKLLTFNGAVASGNIDVGLYAADGTRLVSSGSTAQAGTTVIQEFDVTDTVLAPGWYYLAVAKDDTTGTLRASTAVTARQARALGCFGQTSAFPLPATATFAAYASAYLPVFGCTSRTVV